MEKRAVYMRLYGDYLSERRAFEALLGEDTGFPSRLDLMIGEQSPLTTLISTAVATGDAASFYPRRHCCIQEPNF